jgi:diguanylate cyclase (GGDEF)-like protein
VSTPVLMTHQANGHGLHFLIVDDDEGDRRQIDRAIRRSMLPLNCTETATLEEALAACDQSRFDCAFVDYRLPGEDGLNAISTLREKFPFLPIVMSTGQGDEMVAIEAMKRGASDYIPKSKIDADSIRRVIENGLRWGRQEAESATLRNRLQYLGLNDPLTGLPNRTLFSDRLDQLVLQCQRSGETFTVMMMDLNLFKEINDRLGHHSGDAALCQVAERLTSVVRKTDTVARLGGDEFGCLLPVTKNLANAELVAEKMIDIVRQPMLIDHQPVTLGISIGIAQCPLQDIDGPTLLQRADKAMYEAKKNYQGFHVFNSDSKPNESQSCCISDDLMRGLAYRELTVHFQPQVDLGSRQIVGTEALVRWQHPQQGMISPLRFIPAAEKSFATIAALTDVVLQMALDQEQSWRERGFCVPVSVNLSASLLDDESLPDRILDMLGDRNLPPECLNLELTETALASAPAHACATLRRTADAGIGIFLDDFGAGYTSFKQLRALDFAGIKIDATYVAEACDRGRNASIVHSIAELGRGFDVPVIAKCVEQESSWQTLLDLGCNLAQGFSIGRPMEPAAFDQWRKGWSA